MEIRRQPTQIPKGFEPLLENGEYLPTEPGQKLHIQYDGPYANNLLVNRHVIESFIRLEHLDGKVQLTSLSYNRYRGVSGVNPDGSVEASRRKPFPRKHEVIENPYSLVTSTSSGWTIAINGQQLNQDIADRPKTNKADAQRFARGYNNTLYAGLMDIMLAERFSDVKDPSMLYRKVQSSVNLLFMAGLLEDVLVNHPEGATYVLATIALYNYFANNRFNSRQNKQDRTGFNRVLPPLRIENAMASSLYLDTHSRNLVRLKK